MLQVYLEVPRFLGGGKKKARIIIEKISNSNSKAKKLIKCFSKEVSPTHAI